MLDIGFTELLLVAVIALVVLGPERLPQAIRTTAYWMGKIRRSFQSVKEELEKELDVDGIKQQLHNDAVMKELNKTRDQFQSQINDLKKTVSPDTGQNKEMVSTVDSGAVLDSAERTDRAEMAVEVGVGEEAVNDGNDNRLDQPQDKVKQ
ncbi:Sec-independent protein translocase protein TatB [Endozoicomonas sp.]|uniref:Sec-independent protein translocase protein TatB n=1 Tax=Endozoicomonas sp. TaxID=1892382 RepID=UPI00383ACD14